MIMSEELYNELLKAYTKETLANMRRADICCRFSEPYASDYCQQLVILTMHKVLGRIVGNNHNE